MFKKTKRALILFYVVSLLYIIFYVFFPIVEEYNLDIYFKIVPFTPIRSLLVIIYYIFVAYTLLSIGSCPKESILLDIIGIDIPALLIATYPFWYYSISKHVDWQISATISIIKSYFVHMDTLAITFRIGSLLIGMEIYRYIQWIKSRSKTEKQ